MIFNEIKNSYNKKLRRYILKINIFNDIKNIFKMNSKIMKALTNASKSSSDSLISLFKGKRSADDLLSSTSIIKGMRIGISYLSQDNKPTVLNDIFGTEFTHTSIFFKLELPNNKTTGALVQYGKYEYIDKNKYKFDEEFNVNTIGYPYGKEGGLIFGEMDNKLFESTFCTVGCINLLLGKNFPKMTLKNFIEEVKKINGPWDIKSYDPMKKSCQEFVVAALQVIRPGFSNQLVNLKNSNDPIPEVIERELQKYEMS
jgi:hypothetical protein